MQLPKRLINIRRTPLKKPPHLSTNLYSWMSILVLLCLLLGGVFGLAVAYGRGYLTQATHTSHVFALNVTPSNVAVGVIITLHGTAFSLNGKIALTRDTNITLIDTSGTNIIHADSQGSFNDTAIVDPTWGAGPISYKQKMQFYISLPVSLCLLLEKASRFILHTCFFH